MYNITVLVIGLLVAHTVFNIYNMFIYIPYDRENFMLTNYLLPYLQLTSLHNCTIN